MTDKGKKRQYHQIMRSFLPGQPFDYSPNLGSKSPSLTVMTYEIKNIVKTNNKKTKESINYWYGNKIENIIRNLSNTNSSIEPLEFNQLSQRKKELEVNKIIIDLKIFPKIYTYDKNNIKYISYEIENGVKNIEQAQFLFTCSNPAHEKCLNEEGIHTYKIPGGTAEIYNPKNEKEWRNIKIKHNNNQYPIALDTYNSNNLERLKKEYNENKYSWNFLPTYPTQRKVYVPQIIYLIFYPGIEGEDVVFFETLKELEKTNKISEKDMETIKSLDYDKGIKVLDHFITNEIITDKSIIEAYNFTKNMNENDKEKFKFSQLKKNVPERKKETKNNANQYLKEYKLSSVIYLEPLKVVEMCYGWVSGKMEVNKEENAILRKIPLKVHNKNAIYDKNDATWYLPYNIIDSEGIIFEFEKNVSFKVLHTFSHLILKTLPLFSGIEENLLGEEILKDSNSVIIYSHEPGEFKSFGIKHVFENTLQDLLEYAKESLECPFEEEDDGCLHCLHKAVGCSEGNLKISKKELKEIW